MVENLVQLIQLIPNFTWITADPFESLIESLCSLLPLIHACSSDTLADSWLMICEVHSFRYPTHRSRRSVPGSRSTDPWLLAHRSRFPRRCCLPFADPGVHSVDSRHPAPRLLDCWSWSGFTLHIAPGFWHPYYCFTAPRTPMYGVRLQALVIQLTDLSSLPSSAEICGLWHQVIQTLIAEWLILCRLLRLTASRSLLYSSSFGFGTASAFSCLRSYIEVHNRLLTSGYQVFFFLWFFV